MIVRSNSITQQDIISAVIEQPGMFFIEGIRSFQPRGFQNGFEFFCGGSSARASAHDGNYKSATWIEWGNAIATLYAIDPDARIGHYRSREDFMNQTRNGRWDIAPSECPWLTAA